VYQVYVQVFGDVPEQTQHKPKRYCNRNVI
jgi:hypothetical protein